MQAELTFNIHRQATLKPQIFAWEYFHGPFNYDATPLGPMGRKTVIHNNAGNQKSWDQHGHDGFNAGPALEHYQ